MPQSRPCAGGAAARRGRARAVGGGGGRRRRRAPRGARGGAVPGGQHAGGRAHRAGSRQGGASPGRHRTALACPRPCTAKRKGFAALLGHICSVVHSASDRHHIVLRLEQATQRLATNPEQNVSSIMQAGRRRQLSGSAHTKCRAPAACQRPAAARVHAPGRRPRRRPTRARSWRTSWRARHCSAQSSAASTLPAPPARPDRPARPSGRAPARVRPRARPAPAPPRRSRARGPACQAPYPAAAVWRQRLRRPRRAAPARGPRSDQRAACQPTATRLSSSRCAGLATGMRRAWTLRGSRLPAPQRRRRACRALAAPLPVAAAGRLGACSRRGPSGPWPGASQREGRPAVVAAPRRAPRGSPRAGLAQSGPKPTAAAVLRRRRQRGPAAGTGAWRRRRRWTPSLPSWAGTRASCSRARARRASAQSPLSLMSC